MRRLIRGHDTTEHTRQRQGKFLLQVIAWYGTADAIDGRSTFHLRALYITMLPEMDGRHIFADVPLFYEVYETLRLNSAYTATKYVDS
jgi:hypothetical protein